MRPARKARARQACLSCNARRVKCNVVNSRPCTNCEALDIPCELRESRRGKHPRRSNLSQPSKRPHGQSAQEDLAFGDSREAEASIHSENTSPSAPGRLQAFPAPQATFGDCFGTLPAPIQMSSDFVSQESLVIRDPHDNNDDDLDHHLSASRALAGLSQHETPQPGAIIRPPEQSNPLGETFNRSPLNEQRNGQGHMRQEDEETVFLGESTSLTYLHGTHTSPSTLATPDQGFVYRIPEAVRAQNSTLEWEIERKQAKLKLLHAEGAFSFPAKTATDSLFKAYFEWFHVCFPVLDEPDIWQQYSQGTLHPLLFQAILFIGVMHCAEDELPSVGLGCRQRAKYTLYNRAKDLFDAEIEPKSITVIQSVFLMSFWRAGALLQKDTRHWLAVAVSLAQTKGLHRSSQNTNGEDINLKLRKRLWWSIYIRERQCAAALGLPNRVRDEDCDVEALNEQDFQYAFESPTSSSHVNKSISYIIGMVELSRMLGRIIHRDFLPLKRLTFAEREETKNTLFSWRKSLPLCMRPSGDGLEGGSGFLASMLNLAYNNLLILLFRSGCSSTEPPSSPVDGQVAILAAARNTSIIENMLIEGQICHGQIHVITNVFNTLCIHTLNLKHLQGGRRFVAEQRAKLCLVSLQELQKTWEFKNWILQLFFQYLDQPTAQRLQLGDDGGETGSSSNDSHIPGAGNPPLDNQHMRHQQLQDMPSDSPPAFALAIESQDIGQFLHSQIENRFVNGEGGAIDWYMADLFHTSQS